MKIKVSCKIFEPFNFRIQQLGSTPFKGHHFGTKTSQSTLDSSTPLISGSDILDPDWLSFCTVYTCLFYEIHYLETSGLYYKHVTIVIYDRNDSGQYYKTTIMIVIDDPSLS